MEACRDEERARGRERFLFYRSPKEEIESAQEHEESVGVKGSRLFSVWVIKSRVGRISSGKTSEARCQAG